ncbi:Disease resistance protein [Macleaya cordata]|uniref:Disease resistance protein n=1 Tax=Macleaya cordata TaxID=56857 RepID=A0A200PZX1_MACCD|nr:Disease resistance protein [Macleaya cordata]
MAEVVLPFFLERLRILITEEANLLLGVDEQVKMLQNEFEWMSLFIKNADIKRRADPEVKLLARQIREITFHAEDVIDEFILKIHQYRQRRRDLGWFVGSLKSSVGFVHQLLLLHELGNQIKEINTMTEKITANKSKYSIETEPSHSSSNENSLRQKAVNVKRSAPIVEEWDVVGIEDSTKQVKSLLIEGGDDKRRRGVVSIVGMGGLGKTTLAKKVYNSSDVKKQNFDCFAWVYVSQEYRLKELLQGIIRCVTNQISKEEMEKLDEEESRYKLREYLLGNKYLIVLDDIWNIEAWDGLKTAFPDEMNGSRVLLTTRNKNVALRADPSLDNIHELRFLNKEESWELFLQKVFPLGGGGGGSSSAQESRCPSELEDLGKEMVEKCRGLPLAIVVLGGLLSSKDKTKIMWSKVNDSVSWQLTLGAGSESCSGILASSYYDLPYYLKPCFLYMGLFPEDSEIRSTKLIQYWIAEGFVQTRGEETMEDVAEDYLEELIDRSMIQVGRWRSDGRVKTCRIHDLFRDLSIAESKEDKFFHVYRSNDDFSKANNVRRLTIHGNDGLNEKQCFTQFRYTPHVRSLMCFRISMEDKKFWRSLCGSFKLLVVLELEHIDVEDIFKVPKEIGELVHLRYLGLMIDWVCRLPNSIGRLVNLQTLNLKYCSLIECMPSQIWNLHQLRHLYVLHMEPTPSTMLMWDGWLNARSTGHLGIGNLTNLQTLCLQAGDWIYGGGLDRMRMLKKLVIRGSLVSYKQVISDSIAKLNGLRSLELWSSEEVPELNCFSNHTCLNKLVLDGRLPFEKLPNLFPQNLNKLTFVNSQIKTDPMVILEKLRNLRILQLEDDSYLGEKMVFSKGGFLRLQVLKIKSLKGLKEWKMEEGALTNLTRLEINTCERILMLPDGLRQLTTLQELEVRNMPKKFMARLTENVGEDWVKIKHIPFLNLN